MKYISLKKITLIFIFIIFIVLALPQLKLNIGGSELNFNGVGFANIGLNSNFPSMPRGKGVFESTIYRANITFEDINSLEEDNNIQTEENNSSEVNLNDRNEIARVIFDMVNNRIKYANLYDFETTLNKDTSDNFWIEFNIPANYGNKEEYVNWLINTGAVDAFSFAGNSDDIENFSIVPINVSDTQIKSTRIAQNVIIPLGNDQRQSISLPHLVIELDRPVFEIFNSIAPLSINALQGGESTNRLNIGNISLAVYADPDSEFDSRILRALPIGDSSVQDENDIMNLLLISQSYFKSEVLPLSLEINESMISTRSADFNTEGASIIAISIFFAIGIIGLIILKRKGLKSGLITMITISYVLLLATIFLKMIVNPLSISLIIAFFMIIPILFWAIGEQQEDNTFISTKQSVLNKITLALYPAFIFITISILSSSNFQNLTLNGLVYYVVLLGILLGSFKLIFMKLEDKINIFSNISTLIISLILSTNFFIGDVSNILLVWVICVISLNIVNNLLFRSINSELK